MIAEHRRTWAFFDVTVTAPRDMPRRGRIAGVWSEEEWKHVLCGCGNGGHPYWDCPQWGGTWRKTLAEIEDEQ